MSIGPPTRREAAAGPSARVLVVDDEDRACATLRRFLERDGHSVAVARDGERALELLDNERIDLVLLDMLMPGMNGLEVLRRIRARRPRSQLPVIMTTTVTESAAVVEALELGADDYVGKPFDFLGLLERVREELGRHGDPGTTAEPGPLLAGRYRLGVELGSGAFGVVHRAQDLDRDGEPVAVKILHPELEVDESALASFHQEARVLCRLQHPGLVHVLAFGLTESGCPYLVSELIQGHTLDRLLEDRRRLSPATAVPIGAELAAALAYSHAVGVVHRDVKPAHVLLADTLDGLHPRLLDFGIASLLGRPSGEAGLGLVGTPAYMAPERFEGRRGDDRADVYALGAVLHEMLVGEPPFGECDDDVDTLAWMHAEAVPPRASERERDVPGWLDDLIEACLAKRPEQRPGAAEIAERLGAGAASADAPGSADP